MSKFRIKKITPGKVGRKYAIKYWIVKKLPFVKGILLGAIVMFVYAQITLANAQSEETKRFLKAITPPTTIHIIHAEEEEATPSAKPIAIPKGMKYVSDRVIQKSDKEFGVEHRDSLIKLINHESGFNPFAKNPNGGACGLFQAVPCSKMPCNLSDVDCQIEWGVNYIKARYGNPTNAWAHWQLSIDINGQEVGNWY